MVDRQNVRIFFGGGIFWATYARPTVEAHLFSPRLVGGLAGVAGVGFFVVAVYLLLDRLGRASEREARPRCELYTTFLQRHLA